MDQTHFDLARKNRTHSVNSIEIHLEQRQFRPTTRKDKKKKKLKPLLEFFTVSENKVGKFRVVKTDKDGRFFCLFAESKVCLFV